MKKETLKLLVGMPPELLAAWEKKHPAKRSIRYIAENQVRHRWLAGSASFIWFFLILAAGFIADMGMTKSREPFGVFTFIAFFPAFAGGMFLFNFVYPQLEWDAVLQSLEDAVGDPIFGLKSWLWMGFDLKRIRESADSRLVYAAERVLVAEGLVERARGNKRVSERRLMEELQQLLQERATFDKVLFRVVEFDLSDDDPSPYFIAAGRSMPVPSEGRYKY